MQAPIQPIMNELTEGKKVELYLKREDMLHPHISGNKLRKLKYNLKKAADDQHTLLTFGGAYSNHLYAVAAAGKEHHFHTIGLVRGEEHHPLNPTLQFAQECGMELHYLSRAHYRMKEAPAFISTLEEQHGRFYLVPEGGTNLHAVSGCREIWQDFSAQYDFIAVACGTGGTMAGIIAGAPAGTTILGFPVLKGGAYLHDVVSKLLACSGTAMYSPSWRLMTDYHFGGYARYTPELIDFINAFSSQFQIPLDPIYTGKLMAGIFDLIDKGFFPPGSRIMALHTGGLQGIAGFNQRFGHLIYD